jgi:DnaK suppressor protein
MRSTNADTIRDTAGLAADIRFAFRRFCVIILKTIAKQPYMTPDQKEHIRRRIESDLEAIAEQIAHLEAKINPIAPDCSLGRLTRMEAMNEQEVNQRILDKTRLRQTRLRNALSRIDSEMFGICIDCEEAIGFERMSIRPESVRCVACANGQ